MCTVIGTGTHGDGADGQRAGKTTLYFPSAVRFFSDGSPLIVDFNNMRLRTIEPDGTARVVAGSGWHAGATDGIDALLSPLENPVDALVLPDDGFLIAEYHTGRVLRVDADGWLTVVAGTGRIGYAGDGAAARDASFSELVGLARDPDGRIYIADTDNHCIRRVDPATGVVEGLAGDGAPGDTDGPLDQARFNEPWHLAWHDGGLLVADRGNHRIRRIDLNSGTVETLAGTGVPGHSGDGGPALEAELDLPSGLDVDADGAIWLADRMNNVVRRIDPDGTIDTVLGLPGVPGDGPDRGDASEAALTNPDHVAVAPDGRIWVSDTLNSKVRVYVP